jgi:hypothetical protein
MNRIFCCTSPKRLEPLPNLTLFLKKIVGQDAPYEYHYNERDLLVKTIYPDGNIMDTEYDSYNRPVKVFYDGVLVNETEYFPYNELPNAGTIKIQKTRTTDGNWFEKAYIEHDEFGRPTKIKETYPDNTVNTKDIVYDGPDAIERVNHNYVGAAGVGNLIYHDIFEYGTDKSTVTFDGVQFYPASNPNSSIMAGGSMMYNSNNWLTLKNNGIYSTSFAYHPKGMVEKVNAVSNMGTPTPVCSTSPFIWECDSLPWIILDPELWFNYLVVNDSLIYGNLIIAYDKVIQDSIIQIRDSVFLSSDHNLTYFDSLYYNRNYYGNFEGVLIHQENAEEQIAMMLEALNQGVRVFDPSLHNGSGGGVIPDIPDEFFRRIIPTACDTLLFEEDALLFGQVLHYEKDKPHFKARAQYNGNVSSIVWQILWGERQAYGFQYDQMNRLLQAHYAVYKPDLSISTDNRFGVKVDGYDRDGNIRKVVRRGVVGECEDGFEYGEIDHLNYTYSNGRLNAVSEGSDAERGYSYSGGGFSYDGNVTAMGDRGVTIEYDHHFMPKVIRMGPVERIEFNYAGTRKLSSRYYDGNGDLKESFMYYGRGIIRNDAFYAVECPDARIVLDEEDNKYKVQHHIKDYLGHIRLTVWDRDEDGDLEMEEILYSSDYYPFGMRIDNYFSRMPEEEENYMRRGISGNEESTLLSGNAIFSSGKGHGLIRIYPNPASDEIIIDMQDPPGMTSISGNVTLMHMNGTVLHSRHLASATTHAIDVSSLAAGMYMLCISKDSDPVGKYFKIFILR